MRSLVATMLWPCAPRMTADYGIKRNEFHMKAAALSLVLVLASLKASGQANPGRNQQPVARSASSGAQNLSPGPNPLTGAQYVRVSLAPSAAGVQGGAQGFSTAPRFRMRGGAQYLRVSLAPRRNRGASPAQSPQTP